MDIKMPVLDGLQASEKIKSDASELSPPIIVALSANNLKSDKLACLNSGMVDLIEKPIKLDKIKSIIIKYSTDYNKKVA